MTRPLDLSTAPSTASHSTPRRPRPCEFGRAAIADAILERLDDTVVAEAKAHYDGAQPSAWFLVDQLLPDAMAHVIHRAFPPTSAMRERKTLREHKFVAAQMDHYEAQAEEALFAFQDERVVRRIGAITGLSDLEADPMLYAGGLSVMGHGNFLNPHLDNSHDNDRRLYRVLNLLYYVSPGWRLENGGNLELWPQGLDHQQVTVPSLFNRLVVMATGPQSWHSVSRVESEADRCCVSNYYFDEQPIGGEAYFRVTQFRGRPEEPVRDVVLRLDASLRQAIRKVKPQGLVQTTHLYRRPGEDDPEK